MLGGGCGCEEVCYFGDGGGVVECIGDEETGCEVGVGVQRLCSYLKVFHHEFHIDIDG